MHAAHLPHPATAPAPDGPPVVLDRREGPYGEVVLRRHGTLLQIIANGCFLMDTSDGRSERLLMDVALETLESREAGEALESREAGEAPEPQAGRPAPSVLIGGLGVGFSLAHAAADRRWGQITVVEREAAIIDWHGGPGRPSAPDAAPLAEISAAARTDPRTEIVHADLLTHLRTTGARYDALCLDIDNGPGWTVTEDNDDLYSPAGLAACRTHLTPGGVLAVWSAEPSPEFETALRNAGFRAVHTKEIPVSRGVPDAVHIAVGPR
ncbi:spermidine synthase [Streptomyces odontomachi]|uniref:spermidine synthase n=1 Tax=Streptomyces odontomachi TaxID=2944940 RepID=UPI00210CA5FF|nr:spermidine synthase [Streptomyces sp. ODS25]